MSESSSDYAEQALEQALDWLVLLHSGEATDNDYIAHQQWQEAHPEHAIAWQHADRINQLFQLPQEITKKTLTYPSSARRRLLALLALGLPSAYLLHQYYANLPYTADWQTGIGERETLALGPKLVLTLNSNSALFELKEPTVTQARLLKGEVYIAQQATPEQDGFLLLCPHGTVYSQAAHYSLRLMGQHSRLRVLEGQVLLRLHEEDKGVLVRATEQIDFNQATILLRATHTPQHSYWENNLLLAQDMPLAELVEELTRHYTGWLSFAPTLAQQTVSGAFPIQDTTACLQLLSESLAIRVRGWPPYWTYLQKI